MFSAFFKRFEMIFLGDEVVDSSKMEVFQKVF